MVMGRSYGIALDQASVRAFKLLGYSRTTDAIKIGPAAWSAVFCWTVGWKTIAAYW